MRTDLPNWTTNVEEISNGVYKVTLIDKFGRKAEITDYATEDMIKRAIADAFEIERQITKNWNKFLYELCLLLLRDNSLTFNEYNDLSFGSWFIEISERKRLVYNGRDYWLILQSKRNKEWEDIDSIDDKDLSYHKLLSIIDSLKH